MIHTDVTSYQTLQSVEAADKFNRWMYQTVRQYVYGEILEAGSGIGNISRFFLQDNYSLTLSDINLEYITLLQQKFQHFKNAKAFLNIDLEKENFVRYYAEFNTKYDSVFLLNVLEHIQQDGQAISNCRFLLKQHGSLVVLVPAYRILYAPLDKELGHYRRYTTASLGKLIAENGFSIERSFYFNTLGIAGWLWNKLSGNKSLSPTKMNIFNRLVPLAKLMDIISLHRVGLSAIVVAKKNEGC